MGSIVDEVARDAQAGGEKSFALANETLVADLLDLRLVSVQHIFLALVALSEREEDDALALGVELLGRLLDLGEAAVDAVEGVVTEAVSPLEVGRDVLVRSLEVWDKGLAEALVALGCEVN